MRGEPDRTKQALAEITELLLGFLKCDTSPRFAITNDGLRSIVEMLSPKLLQAADQREDEKVLRTWRHALPEFQRRLLAVASQTTIRLSDGLEIPLLTESGIRGASNSRAFSASTQLTSGELVRQTYSTLDEYCHRISVISTSTPQTVVQVTWLAPDGTSHTETDVRAGGQTPCFGKVSTLTLMAINGDAVVMDMYCPCP